MDFSKIKAFVFDVDGVLTDGGLLADLNGEFYRTFDSKDGFGLRMAMMHGYGLGIITGGRSQSIRQRFLACGFNDEDIYLHSRNKMEEFADFCNRHSFEPAEVMYFGDDIPDVEVMIHCGCGVAPADAVEEAKEAAAKEAQKVMDAAKLSIEQARKESELQFRSEVSQFALQIAEQVVRRDLADDKSQAELVDKLLNEVESKN